MVKLYKTMWKDLVSNEESIYRPIDQEEKQVRPQDTCVDHWFEYVFIMREIPECWSCYINKMFYRISGKDICNYHSKQLEDHRNREYKCQKCFDQPYKGVN